MLRVSHISHLLRIQILCRIAYLDEKTEVLRVAQLVKAYWYCYKQVFLEGMQGQNEFLRQVLGRTEILLSHHHWHIMVSWYTRHWGGCRGKDAADAKLELQGQSFHLFKSNLLIYQQFAKHQHLPLYDQDGLNVPSRQTKLQIGFFLTLNP